MRMRLSADSPAGPGSLGKPNHLRVVQSGQPFPHPGCLRPGTIGNYQGYRPWVLIQKTSAENGNVVSGIEEKGSPLGNVEIAEVKDTVPIPLNAQFTVGERDQGQGSGGGGLGEFAIVHHEYQAGRQVIDGN
jgi:hypothetical protein